MKNPTLIPNLALQRGSSKTEPTAAHFAIGMGFQGIAIQIGPGDAELSVEQTKFLLAQLSNLVDLVKWDEAIARGHGR